jgi:hypothetical protein
MTDWSRVWLSVLLASCAAPAPEPDCRPDAERHAAEVAPLLTRYCGECHGDAPSFGAPMSLMRFDDLLAERPGGLTSDLVAHRVAEGTMPPAGLPRVPDEVARAIVDWASCGELSPSPHAGLHASAPPFIAPTTPPEGLETLDLLAREMIVPPDARDLYRCFVFDAPIDRPRFVRRFETVIDDARVVHHLILLRDPERSAPATDYDCIDSMPTGSQYLYAWAPGQSALEFPEGGLRISPGERLVMQIHYNNGAAYEDVRDSSGTRLHLDEVRGTEWGMSAMGPVDFSIAPHARSSATSRCTLREPMRILAGMPHMHALGTDFVQTIEHPSGSQSTLIALSGWAFGTQLFYALPTELAPGDVVTTTCTWQNPSAERVESGPATADEMCFGFMYVTPPPTERYCDEGDGRPTDIAYAAGACAPPSPGGDGPPPLVRTGWLESEAPPPLRGGSIPDGEWVLEEVPFYVSRATTPIGEIDLAATFTLGRGRAWTSGGTLTIDYDVVAHIQSVEGLEFGGPDSVSIAFEIPGGAASPVTLEASCGGEGIGPAPVEWEVVGDRLTAGFVSDAIPGATLFTRYVFGRAR